MYVCGVWMEVEPNVHPLHVIHVLLHTNVMRLQCLIAMVNENQSQMSDTLYLITFQVYIYTRNDVNQHFLNYHYDYNKREA